MTSLGTKRQLRVAHVIKGLGRGGAETLIGLCAQAGRAGNNYSTVYFVPWKDALVRDLDEAGVEAHCLPASSSLRLLTRIPTLARWLRKHQIDVVHAHLPLSGVVARLACHMASVPMVYTEHNLQERYHPLTRRANLLTWGLQSQVVAVSQEVADSVAKHATGKRRQQVPVRVVHNGIDTSTMRNDAESAGRLRSELGIPESAPVVGTVAVFRKQKRLDHWLEVARRLVESHPDAHFLLVGDGPLRAELEELARTLRLRSVHWVGLQKDVSQYLSAMDLFLMTSEFEGLPLALLEAMSCELPVVVTSVGGIAEVVTPESARLCAFEDLDDLTGSCSDLLSKGQARRSLGAQARAVIERNFSVERMAGELEEIYLRAAKA